MSVKRWCWAVAIGEYSDYRVLAVYLSKQTAEATVTALVDAKPDGRRLCRVLWYNRWTPPWASTG